MHLDRLADVVGAAFGTARHLTGVTRLRGGSKKGVYRLGFDDGFSAILYVWAAAENYWPADPDAAGTDPADPFADASGLNLFEASQACLDSLGVRTPRAYLLDGSRTRYPADVALVEDVRGEMLEARLERDPDGAAAAMAALAASLTAMRGHQSARFGKVALIGDDNSPQQRSEQVILGRALRHLDHSAARVDRIAQVRDDLAAVLAELTAAVRPRTEYSLIHGELGPDHVLLDEHDQPVLIDIEGLAYFDVEWEHAFLRLRFGEHYHSLRADDLDEDRMGLYRLAMHLSLVAGPLRLLDGDFPDRDFMLGIVDYNTGRALEFLR